MSAATHTTARNWKLGCLIALMGVFVPAFLVFAWVVWLFSAEPNVSVRYVDLINERALGVPEAERAWPVLIGIIADAEAHSAPWRDRKGDFDEPQRRDEMRAYLAAHPDILPRIRAAAGMTGLGYIAADAIEPAYAEAFADMGETDTTPSDNPFAIELLLYQLGHIRQLGMLLRVDAHLALEEGDPDRFVEDVTAIHRLGVFAGENRALISGLTEIAMHQLERELIDEARTGYAELIDETHLRQLMGLLAPEQHAEVYRLDVTGEGYFIRDYIQRAYSDDARGGGRFTSEGFTLMLELDGRNPDRSVTELPGRVYLLATAKRREEVERWVNRVEQLAQGEHEVPFQRRGSPAYEAYLGSLDILIPSDDPGLMILNLMAPDWAKASDKIEELHLANDAARTAIALELFHRQNGSYPNELDELVPAYLPSVPIDRADGQPLRYRLVDGRPLLYSVGADFDDDGGRHNPKAARLKRGPAPGIPPPNAPDGDWVFLPAPESEIEQ